MSVSKIDERIESEKAAHAKKLQELEKEREQEQRKCKADLEYEAQLLGKGWLPIDDADKSTPQLCMGLGWSQPAMLIWKKNERITKALADNWQDMVKHYPGIRDEYWGDMWEMDDLKLATDEGRARIFYPVPL